jgi:hypothetical protein
VDSWAIILVGEAVADYFVAAAGAVATQPRSIERLDRWSVAHSHSRHTLCTAAFGRMLGVQNVVDLMYHKATHKPANQQGPIGDSRVEDHHLFFQVSLTITQAHYYDVVK